MHLTPNSSIRLIQLALGFLSGQGAVQIVTMLTGLILLRILSVEQYALYTLAASILAIVSLGSNMGLTQAVISFGSPQSADRRFVGELVQSAQKLSRRLMVPAALTAFVTAYFMFSSQVWAAPITIVCACIAVSTGLAQLGAVLGKGILSIHHDARSMFRVGMADAGVRFLCLPLAALWPTAVTPLLAGLAGAILATVTTKRLVARYCDVSAAATPAHVRRLLGFIVPIAPIAIYSVFQGQIGIILLSSASETRAVAETGALSRIGQLFAILVLINPFLVQPLFARIQTRHDFFLKSCILICGLGVLCIVTLTSAYVFPQLWLLIIGDKYSHLSRDLPIALAAALATLVGGTLYTLVVSKGSTKWHWLALLPCLSVQLAYIAISGVSTTTDALMFTLLPAVAYASIQLGFLVRTVQRLPS